MTNGTRPTTADLRDLSYHRTYQTYGTPDFPTSFTVDIGKTNWNQNIPNPPAYDVAIPEGCTGFTQSDNLGDQYGQVTKPAYVYQNTCDYEGHDTNQGCDIRNSLKMTQVYGVQFLDDTVNNRGGRYFNIHLDGGVDWFDGIKTAVFNQKVGASIGSPWFPSWLSIPAGGTLTMPTNAELLLARNAPYSLPWHNYSCKGFEGDTLLLKPWLGHFVYMPREVADVVLDIPGSAAFIQPKYTPLDLLTIKLSTVETLLVKLYRLLGGSRLN